MTLDRLLLRSGEVAELLGISGSKASRMMRRGLLPSIKVGPRAIRAPVDALRAWIAANERVPRPVTASAETPGDPDAA
jgi:excisionase family DNA binding protein